MSSERGEFEQVRRLLGLKRYEQPPPGYFNSFSRQVVERIKAGEHRIPDDVMEITFAQVPWVQRFWAILEGKPIFAGAFGAAICALLITGIVYSSQMDSQPSTIVLSVQEPESAPAQVANATDMQPLINRIALSDQSSTGGVMNLPLNDSLFQEFRDNNQQLRIQPVSDFRRSR